MGYFVIFELAGVEGAGYTAIYAPRKTLKIG
jgi:hypothetical protein